MNTELMTVEEAATALRHSRHTLNRWRGAGTGPAFRKIGGRIFYTKADVESYIDGARVENDE
ncbi:helix-turn-helix domain-containing protein [Breoghania sp.]|uniref:helix-turn-helix domain-containing protein n=1 Tax=Breoghania sp. TaxID=2065378 RepID=UPI002AA9177B|nr:helix-turn-helix domain-containing protein [Breoghania sp.]